METGLTPSFFRNVDWTGVVQAGPGRVGAFELRAPLGRGRDAEVWRATHTQTRTSAALRFLVGDDARSAEAHLRLRRDARRIARLDHPTVVQLFEVGTAGEEAERVTGGRVHRRSPFLAMEQLSSPFRAACRRAESEEEVLAWFDTLLDGLAYCHASDIHHGDVKPSNLMMRGHCPVWIDFCGDEGEDAGVLEGHDSLRYAAPEELRGNASTAATDIYRFALLVAEMLSGEVPNADSPRRRLFGAPKFGGLKAPPDLIAWLEQALGPKTRFRSACEGALAWPRPITTHGGRDNTPMPSTLELHRLRRPAFVGREAPRRALEAKLHALTSRATPFTHGVHGPKSSGKTRFVEWGSMRARRLGLQVLHPSPDSPLEILEFASEQDTPSVVVLEDIEPSVAAALSAALQRSTLPIGLLFTSKEAGAGSFEFTPFSPGEQAALASVLGLHARVRVPANQQPGELVRHVSDSLREGSLVIHKGRLVPRDGEESGLLFEPTFAHAFAEDVLSAFVRFGTRIGEEWTRACEGVEEATREELIDHWLTLGMIAETPRGNSGANTRSFEVRELARSDERWKALSTAQQNALDAACALALAPEKDALSRARRARHLRSSGAVAHAETLDAVEALLRSLRVSEARELLGELNELTDPAHRIRHALALGRAYRLLGDKDAARAALADARRQSLELPDHVWRIRCDQRAAGLARSDGDLDEAVRLGLRAYGAAKRSGDERVAALAALDLAASALAARVPLPPRLLDDASEAFRALGEDEGQVEVEVWRGRVAIQSGDLNKTRAATRTAEKLWKRSAPHPGVETLRGRIAATSRDLDAAEAHFRRAGELYIALGHGLSTDVELRLGSVLLEMERWEEAWHVLSNALAALEARGRSDRAAAAAIALCVLDLEEDDWARFDARVDDALAAQVPVPAAVSAAYHRTLDLVTGERRERLLKVPVESPTKW